MIPPNDVVADLPAPMDDEPPSVRQDIADELADHLACAYRRELLTAANEPKAQERVLDRFGDPRRIAYQLWFQSLWRQIMFNRFTRVVHVLKIAVSVAALLLVLRVAEQHSALHRQIGTISSSCNSLQSQVQGTQNLLEKVLERLPELKQSSDEHRSSQSLPNVPGLERKNSSIHPLSVGSQVSFSKDVLLNFTADWCAPCQRMNPILNKLREQGYSIHDVDVDRERDVAARFSVTSIPTVIQLANGHEVMRKTGAMSEKQFIQIVQ